MTQDAQGVGVGQGVKVLIGGTAVIGTIVLAAGIGVELADEMAVAEGGLVFVVSGALRVAVSVGPGVNVKVGVTVGSDVPPNKPGAVTASTGAASSPGAGEAAGIVWAGIRQPVIDTTPKKISKREM